MRTLVLHECPSPCRGFPGLQGNECIRGHVDCCCLLDRQVNGEIPYERNDRACYRKADHEFHKAFHCIGPLVFRQGYISGYSISRTMDNKSICQRRIRTGKCAGHHNSIKSTPVYHFRIKTWQKNPADYLPAPSAILISSSASPYSSYTCLSITASVVSICR